VAARRRCRQEWRELTEQWRRSNLSGVDFARQEGVNPNTFAWWRSELAREETKPLTLVRVRTQVASRAEPVEVLLPSGVVVRVPISADLMRCAELVARLQEI
jgi:hypothetical protein